MKAIPEVYLPPLLTALVETQPTYMEKYTQEGYGLDSWLLVWKAWRAFMFGDEPCPDKSKFTYHDLNKLVGHIRRQPEHRED